jgi:hypothetical protein
MGTEKSANILIAEFMGAYRPEKILNDYEGTFLYKEGVRWRQPEMLYYHSSWDWLMPAWKKFSDLKFIDSSVTAIHLNYCARITHALATTDIYTAHKHLSNGIKWYNQQPK